MNFKEFLTHSDEPYVIYDNDRIVYHFTGSEIAKKIKKEGFKTGKELNVSEKRGAVYFSDKNVNYGLYSRNQEGEIYQGQEIGKVQLNIKGLKLLNMNYKDHYKKYKNFVVWGELDNLPNCDGSIFFLEDGRIYEVALKVQIANNKLNQP